jgi:hypothetical protein
LLGIACVLGVVALLWLPVPATLARARQAITAYVTIGLGACAGQTATQHADAPPHYTGTCTLAGIEEVPAPPEQQGDAVTLIARYRFGGAAPSDEALWTTHVQVARARAHDRQLELEAHPTIVCNPDARTRGHEAAPEEVAQ